MTTARVALTIADTSVGEVDGRPVLGHAAAPPATALLSVTRPHHTAMLNSTFAYHRKQTGSAQWTALLLADKMIGVLA
jgi:hypothetical protein